MGVGKTDEELRSLQEKNRQKLLAHLDTVCDEDIMLKGKRKSIQKGFPADQADFRGSRYRGVSKNKGKWQVGLFFKTKIFNSRLFKSSNLVKNP